MRCLRIPRSRCDEDGVDDEVNFRAAKGEEVGILKRLFEPCDFAGVYAGLEAVMEIGGLRGEKNGVCACCEALSASRCCERVGPDDEVHVGPAVCGCEEGCVIGWRHCHRRNGRPGERCADAETLQFFDRC